MTGLRLNLGCCDVHEAGFVNVDRMAPADLLADLNDDWPWDDSSVDEVHAYDIIEHLPDKIHTMNEMWRVLKPEATAWIIVPTTDGRGAFQDPTHVSFWNRNSFLYYTAHDAHRERFGKHYGILARFAVLGSHEERIKDEVTKLNIRLRAIKVERA